MKEKANQLDYDLIEILDKTMLITSLRIDRETLPEGLYCYDLRHGDDGTACTLENAVLVNHFGTVISKEPCDFNGKTFIEIEDSLNFLSVPSISLQDYMAKTVNELIENETDLKKLRVLIVEPEKPPYVAEIENNLRSLQEMVGGNIQYVELDRDTFFYCNEEGKLLGLLGNRKLDNGDIVAGTFIICREDGTGEEASLTDEQIEKYMRRFREPELYTVQEVEDASYVSVKSYNSSDDFLKALFDAEDEDEDEMEL